MLSDIILWLTKHLYPTGKVWKMPLSGFFEALHIALGKSEARTIQDVRSIFDSILPDNDNFTADDATAWERRLGLITNTSVSLADRMAAIRSKMAGAGPQAAKSHYLFIESILQDSGFDVYVYENIFPDGMGGYTTKDPLIITAGIGAQIDQYGEFEYGQAEYGSYYENIIANYIDETIDWTLDIGDDLSGTFFIGGPTLGAFADVPEVRKAEFRQLILRIKPTQNVGYLFINYI